MLLLSSQPHGIGPHPFIARRVVAVIAHQFQSIPGFQHNGRIPVAIGLPSNVDFISFRELRWLVRADSLTTHPLVPGIVEMHIVHLDLVATDVDDFRFVPFAIRFDFNTLAHARLHRVFDERQMRVARKLVVRREHSFLFFDKRQFKFAVVGQFVELDNLVIVQIDFGIAA